MDWTDFAKDDQSCFSIQLITVERQLSLPVDDNYDCRFTMSY